jgi:hypothetical protein
LIEGGAPGRVVRGFFAYGHCYRATAAVPGRRRRLALLT